MTRIGTKHTKKVNNIVYDTHKGKPVFVHEIKLLTPVSEDLLQKINSKEKGTSIEVIESLLESLNNAIHEILMDTFESDVAEITSYADGPILG